MPDAFVQRFVIPPKQSASRDRKMAAVQPATIPGMAAPFQEDVVVIRWRVRQVLPGRLRRAALETRIA